MVEPIPPGFTSVNTGRSPPPHSAFVQSFSLSPVHPSIHPAAYRSRSACRPASSACRHRLRGPPVPSRSSHLFLQIRRAKRRGRRTHWPRPRSAPRQHVLRGHLLLRASVPTPSGTGWWRTSGGDEERRRRRGGPMKREGRGVGSRWVGPRVQGSVCAIVTQERGRGGGGKEGEEGWRDTSLQEAAASAGFIHQPAAARADSSLQGHGCGAEYSNRRLPPPRQHAHSSLRQRR